MESYQCATKRNQVSLRAVESETVKDALLHILIYLFISWSAHTHALILKCSFSTCINFVFGNWIKVDDACWSYYIISLNTHIASSHTYILNRKKCHVVKFYTFVPLYVRIHVLVCKNETISHRFQCIFLHAANIRDSAYIWCSSNNFILERRE